VRVGAGAPHLGKGRLHRAPLVEQEMGDGSGRRPAMHPVVAVEVDGPGQVANGLGDPEGLRAGHAVVADRQVDVAHPVLPGGLDVGPHAVHRDNRFDAQALE
jgi:hypothetical protein